jgi:hypothetical protein
VQPASLPRIKVPAISDRLTAFPDSGVTLDLLDNLCAAPPSQATRVTLGRTPAHLHVLFQCVDTFPWATITRRDAPLYQEETVEVFFDPFADLECYFEIEVNPLNAVLALMLRRERRGWRKDLHWDCQGLETSVSRATAGWTASLVIPFSAVLPRPPAPGAIWRANFLRIDRPAAAPRELSAWSPTGRATFHESTRLGFLEF